MPVMHIVEGFQWFTGYIRMIYWIIFTLFLLSTAIASTRTSTRNILAVAKAAHLNLKTKMFDLKARVLIGE